MGMDMPGIDSPAAGLAKSAAAAAAAAATKNDVNFTIGLQTGDADVQRRLHALVRLLALMAVMSGRMTLGLGTMALHLRRHIVATAVLHLGHLAVLLMRLPGVHLHRGHLLCRRGCRNGSRLSGDKRRSNQGDHHYFS
jgi:hypothetical protein